MQVLVDLINSESPSEIAKAHCLEFLEKKANDEGFMKAAMELAHTNKDNEKMPISDILQLAELRGSSKQLKTRQ